MTRYSVNVTPCRTIKYSAALLRWTVRCGCRLYLFVCDESLPPADGTPSTYTCRYVRQRRGRERERYFFLIRERRQQPFTQIRFWPKKSRIKLINYKSSLLSVSLASSLGFWPNSTALAIPVFASCRSHACFTLGRIWCLRKFTSKTSFQNLSSHWRCSAYFAILENCSDSPEKYICMCIQSHVKQWALFQIKNKNV